MKKGFTLIELAIVLVIVGLIIGGLLAANSMITSAQILKTVANLEQRVVATQNFKTTYKLYPGDSPMFTPPGSGDNIIANGANGSNTCAAAPNALLSNSEVMQSYSHLAQAGMIQPNYQSWSPTTCGGPHASGTASSSLAGVVWPYTDVSGTVTATFFVKKYPSMLYKLSADTNPYIYLLLNPSWVIPMETKLSAQASDNSGKQEGAVNVRPLGMCSNQGGVSVSCTSSAAIYGVIQYYLPTL